MLKINKLAITSVLILTQWAASAQINTNSPYTRFGYGELGQRSFGAGRAMGGVGYGLRSSKQINPMNPASYSCMDSLTFLFDFGVGGQLSWFDDSGNTQHDVNGNVEYIAMQFPITKRIAMSAGILPYSFVGYQFGAARSNEYGVDYTETYDGSGGLSEVYAGIAVDLVPKRLSVGANFGYLFGTLKHEQIIGMTQEASDAYNTNRYQELKVKNFMMDFGLQYTHPFSKTSRAVLGFTYSPKRDLDATRYDYLTSYTSGGSSSIVSSDTTSRGSQLAPKYGVGVSFMQDNKYMVAADFSYESWDDMKYFGETGCFKNRYRAAIGGEYIPAYNQKLYFKRIRYRMGAHYGNSYMRFNRTDTNPGGESYDEVGASIGFGLPLIDNRSFVNVAFEYTKKLPTVKTGMIGEQYFKFTVNYTFNELWFFKRKLD